MGGGEGLVAWLRLNGWRAHMGGLGARGLGAWRGLHGWLDLEGGAQGHGGEHGHQASKRQRVVRQPGWWLVVGRLSAVACLGPST